MYFSIRKPTEDERHGARPPAVNIATFAYIGDGFRARGGVEYIVCVVGVRRGRGRGAGGRVAAAARPPVAWIVQQADEVATADDLSVVYPESLRRLRALAPHAEGERAAALVV